MSRELELLGLLQEECAEVIQIVSKVRRFGYDSKNPYDSSGKSNLTLLEDEVGDVYAIMALLRQEGNVNQERIDQRVQWKLAKLEQHWGYKLEAAQVPDNDKLIADLETVLVFMCRLTKQGEDSIWRPSDRAIPIIEQAITLLKAPKPRPLIEVMEEIWAMPGAAEAWAALDDDLANNRKTENILCEIREAKEQGWRFVGDTERKYLLRQAADILEKLEAMPEAEEETETDED